MVEYKLAVPEGYDSASNPRVASFAAQLDDQLARLKKSTADLSVTQLEWQSKPGVNTIGMLLAHLAIVDVSWMRLRPREIAETETDAVMKEIIGIGMDDDGIPISADGRHPATLAGKTITDYFDMIDAARAVSHQELRSWRDADLVSTYAFKDRIITREWTAYHVLEHFCGHYGQILFLKHQAV